MIHVHDLRKLYDDYLAVDGVSFSLHPGQICGLVGPNGAGKTTTMRCLAGLIRATAGSIEIAGGRICDSSTQRDSIALKRQLAYVPDDPPLFDDLTVQQHLDFIGRIYGVTDHLAKANSLLSQFDLQNKRDAGATTLSRGMRQKLAVACAYLYDPSVLLLDEPLTGLDPPGIRTLLQSIRDRAASGATIIISSHLLAMIEDVCTHLLVMQNGKAKYFGESADLRSQFPEAATLEAAYFAATSDHSSYAPLPGLSAIDPLNSHHQVTSQSTGVYS
ncbi:ABC transporter ATP-binding protein [Rubripirellula reticaptiva]|uniref:ABC-type transporter ATP-binding protein EcsA n=1 Tax=Rubripirellula reticaptiva TaxID=2528013 RepID=A0A5C6ESP0_9BACT|nr:ABC transporter ATP-binding protein [Rubripirellula reticaptiva]TWU51374.1 ABC-type transporter ATP-binding protein EcsA [Rubripirellula reticaptiva]